MCISIKFEECFKEISKVYSRKFHRVFQEHFMGVSSKIKGRFRKF